MYVMVKMNNGGGCDIRILCAYHVLGCVGICSLHSVEMRSLCCAMYYLSRYFSPVNRLTSITIPDAAPLTYHANLGYK